MKHFLVILLAALMLFAMCGCAQKGDGDVTPPEPGVTSPTEPEDTSAPETTTEATTTEAVTTTEDTTTEAVTTTEATTTEATTTTEAATTAVTTTTEATTTPVVTTAETMAIEPASGTMYAIADVNVRSGPAATYERLGHLDSGDAVEITGVAENGWYRIVFKGGVGYVGGSYLSAEKPAAVTTAATTAATTATTKATAAATTATTAAEKKVIDIMKNMTVEIECPTKVSDKRSSVKYGTVTHKTYYSTTTKLNRGVNILLPANYDKSKKYPVVYLLHGIFCDEYTMTGDPSYKVAEISANLAADGLAKEMIIVCPNMYATSDPNQQPALDPDSVLPYDNFINDLVTDLMPYIEKNYSVLTGRENTAILGFSMGGREALFIGLQRPDLFAYVGAISPAPGLTPGQDWAMKHPGQLKESELTFSGKSYSPDLLMVCCGTDDHTVGGFPKSYHEILDRNKTTHIWYEIPGADHDDKAVRSGINNFLKNIFPDR